MVYDPAQLPEPDKLHVVVLSQSLSIYTYTGKFILDPPTFEVPRGWDLSITCEFSVTDEIAVGYVVRAWRGLIAGEGERCHNPAFGVRFFKSGVVFLLASICWECSNIFLEFPQTNETDVYEFDSQDESAQDLLRWLKYLYGR